MSFTFQTLTPDEGVQALKIARHALETYVSGDSTKYGPKPEHTEGLEQDLGSFVTIHTGDGQLRGCIGHMIGQGSLFSELENLAIAAGTQDPRFPAIIEEELSDISYEVSVLSIMKETAAEDVIAGTHGLMIKNGVFSGVLLPQVALERGWDRVTFLEQTCLKAGLPKDIWQDPNTIILTYTAQVFSE